MVVLTIAARNYTAHALCLSESLRALCRGATVVLCVPERPFEIPSEIAAAFDHVFFPDILGYDNINVFMFRHTVVEGCTAVKARALLYLLARYPQEDQFVFLDPDMLVYTDLATLFSSALADIILTPHLISGEVDPRKIGPPFFRVLNGGIFNLGMIGIRRSTSSTQFLRWWDGLLQHFCYAEADLGFFVDQKWVDFALGFTDPHVVRDPGYNIGWWNLPARWLEFRDGTLTVNGIPVKVLHFSGLVGKEATAGTLRYLKREHLMHRLAEEYNNKLQTRDLAHYSAVPWSFDYFQSGEVISREVRIAFRRSLKLQNKYIDPYTHSNDAILSERG